MSAISAARFDLIWLPSPAYAGELSAGYNPKQYFKVRNSYGTESQQQQLLRALLAEGVEPVADVVINHRDGTNGWVDFQNPTWKINVICRTDEAFTDPRSGVTNTPGSARGDCEEKVSYRPSGTFNYESFRDINHADPLVRNDILSYLLQLKALGYRGWRYDMVHGYSAKWVSCYNAVTKPTFVVGEYDWDKQGEMRGWIWATALMPDVAGVDHLRTSSSVFDFPTFFRLKDAINKGTYSDLYGFNFGPGLIGDTTDSLPWKQRAVTFVENHDTGYRTKEDSTPEKDHVFDSFANNWAVEQAYAMILTHPGLPSVYWKHYFEWGGDLQNKIKALINARKVAGVHAGSDLYLQNNARQAGVYGAAVKGNKGMLYVRIGGSDDNWQPFFSNYRNYREYAQGAGWKVWVELPGNPPFQFAALPTALPPPSSLQPLPATLPRQCAP
ncbi:alpha-amylase family glycosyl hydrolase [Synechococcus sp. CBW1107]|uniref:alpha-amylase family glycosyl hydrolase n=1 Tax=Synechococcus sp. CBW1107 TaxID=2789857 RepID=UPI002AD4FEFC|nr:alpha-amylase family glycosyl hydrolase [Synechococcus sp. CBW1107]